MGVRCPSDVAVLARHLPLSLVLALVITWAGPGQAEDPPGEAEADAGAEVFAAELRADAARIRGLEWKREISVAALSRNALRARMEDRIEKQLEPGALERQTRILRRLGLLGLGEDLLGPVLSAMELTIDGLYDPDEKRIHLIEGVAGDAGKAVVLHELIHALEDQHLGIGARIESRKKDSDRTFAEWCLVEGSAQHACALYQKEHPETAREYAASQSRPDRVGHAQGALGEVPAYACLPSLLHYELGSRFVERAVGSDYPAGMKALYEDPPVSQEQLMHPARWFGSTRDFPRKVKWSTDFATLAGEGWTKLQDVTIGELDLALFLDFFLGYTRGRVNVILLEQGMYVVPRAKAAAAGWDAGRTYYMEREGHPIVWIQALAFDSEADAVEATDALHATLRRRYGDTYVEGDAREEVAEDGSRTHILAFASSYGPGRLFRRGDQVFLLDGAPEDLRETLSSALLDTSFESDERDTWDPALEADALADCDFVDEILGVGLKLPADDWQLLPGMVGEPGVFAEVSKGEVAGTLTLVQAPLAMLRSGFERQRCTDLPAGVEMKATDAEVCGGEGIVYEWPHALFYLGGAGGKALIFVVRGTPAALTELRNEIDGIAREVVIKGD